MAFPRFPKKIPLEKLDKQPKFDPALKRFQLADVKDLISIGSGSFAYVEKGLYNNKYVALKRLHQLDGIEEILPKFQKEGELLSKTIHDNIVKLFAVADQPGAALMLELCEFDFSPFGRDKRVSSLEQFLKYLDSQNLTSYFPGIGNQIAKDILDAVSFLHLSNLVHRDIKPANILLSNRHYLGLSNEEIVKAFQKRQVVAKLGDLGEARSQFLKTNKNVMKTKTRFLDRGSEPFMAPELLVKNKMIVSAGLVELKAIDVWAMLMTFFVILNPDQLFPFKRDIASDMSSAFDFSNLFANQLKKEKPPSFSDKYEILQAKHYQHLRQLFYESLIYDQQNRPNVQDLNQKFKETLDASYFPLKVSQATALEDSDKAIASNEELLKKNDYKRPVNDATNACCYLVLSIIDTLSASFPKDHLQMVDQISRVIQEMPVKINPYRNIEDLTTISHAYSLLSNFNFLNNMFIFEEKILSSFKIYSYEFHKFVISQLELMQRLCLETSNKKFAIVHIEQYVFCIAVDEKGRCFIIDTHPISENVKGNGNGIVVLSNDLVSLSQWISERLIDSGVENTSRSSFQLVTLEKRSESVDTGECLIQRSDPCQSSRDEQINKASDKQTIETSKTSKVPEAPETKNNEKEEVDKSNELMPNDDEIEFSLQVPGSSKYSAIVVSDDLPDEPSLPAKSPNLSPSFHQSRSSGKVEPNGALYRGDEMLPVFSWAKKAYSWKEIANILLSSFEKKYLCTSHPFQVSNNVTFLISNNHIANNKDILCDDMGVWKHNGSPIKLFFIDANTMEMLSCTKDYGSSYKLKRSYFINASSTDLHRTLSTLEDPDGKKIPFTLVQYLFDHDEHELLFVKPHGNSKNNNRPHRRLLPSVIEKMKSSSFSDKTPKECLDEIYVSSGDCVDARTLGQLPRGPRDIYNARQDNKRTNGKNFEGSSYDKFYATLEKAKQEENGKPENAFIRDCRVHPQFFAVLALKQQLDELELFCTNSNGFGIFNIDPTFNIFTENISLTVTTYRNLKLKSTSTGESPVFIGPLLIHQKKDINTYEEFAHRLVKLKPELEALIACGTDGEVAISQGFEKYMPLAIFLRCFIHYKRNIKDQLKSRGFSNENMKLFMEEIFGKQVGDTKHFGLVDASTEEEFDDKLDDLKEIWKSRETESSASFYDWFLAEKAEEIKLHMLKPVRVRAGLGDPPSEFTTNDVEAGNSLLKKGLHFNKQKPEEFIEKIKSMIMCQFRNEERAIFGMGPYRVNSQFQKYSVNEFHLNNYTAKQKLKKKEDFFKATMDDSLDSPDISDLANRTTLSISADDSGIKSVPIITLRSMFDKARILLQDEKLVVEKPGASDGSFVVAGQNDKAYFVKPGSGNSFNCDRTCVNKKIKICEHVIAVAEKVGKLGQFIEWFKNTKPAASITNLAMCGAAKTVGKKPNPRKHTNKRKPEPTSYVDLIQDKISRANITVPNSFSYNQTLPVQASPSQIALLQQQQFSLRLPPSIVFFKFLTGTTVSMCYGCETLIFNPPLNMVDNLIIARRDYRQFRHRVTGQLNESTDQQNVHFHLRLHCILARYPSFTSQDIKTDDPIIVYFSPEQKHRIWEEFGISL